VSGLDVGPERSDSARPEDALHARFLHRPQVRSVVDAVRRELVLAAVPRDERYGPPRHITDQERRRRGAVRRLDLDLSNVIEERVEAGSPEDADLGRAQADFSFALPFAPVLSDEPDDAEESDEDEDEEDDVSDFAARRLSVL
jgi:hypothetical protein